jgi:prevent-host-death family protein
MTQINVEAAGERLADLIAAAVRGEGVVITQANQPLVKLVPIEPPRGPRQAGSAKGLIWMAEDFDAPLVDFKEYME